jgi:hypothetical protein
MNKKAIKWGLVIPGGWFVILIGAAIFLPPHSTRFALRTVPLLALTYEFVVNYTSHVSQEWVRDHLKLPMPFWSRERGTVQSKRVTVIVTP